MPYEAAWWKTLNSSGSPLQKLITDVSRFLFWRGMLCLWSCVICRTYWNGHFQAGVFDRLKPTHISLCCCYFLICSNEVHLFLAPSCQWCSCDSSCESAEALLVLKIAHPRHSGATAMEGKVVFACLDILLLALLWNWLEVLILLTETVLLGLRVVK